MEILRAIEQALEHNPQIVRTIAVIIVIATVFIGVGIFVRINGVDSTPLAEHEKAKNKLEIWLRWSLFISAFWISPIFFAVALLAVFFGFFRKEDKNWKLALAIVCVAYALVR